MSSDSTKTLVGAALAGLIRDGSLPRPYWDKLQQELETIYFMATGNRLNSGSIGVRTDQSLVPSMITEANNLFPDIPRHERYVEPAPNVTDFRKLQQGMLDEFQLEYDEPESRPE